MKKFLPFSLLLFGFSVVGCAGNSVVQNTNVNRFNSVQANKVVPDGELQKRIEQIASAANGHVGVKAVVLESGEAASLNAADHFPMQSVYKLPISMAVLKQVEEKYQLDQKIKVEKSDFVKKTQHSRIRDENPNGVEMTIEELIRFAISESDGTASDVLFKLAGGADALSKYLGEIGVTEMRAANTEKEMGADWETQYRNYASPDAAVELLRALYERRGISEKNQAVLMKMLIESAPGAKRLKGLLPNGTIVAHKTGTSGSRNNVTAATNDIGIITLPNEKHLAIAVFVSDSPADEKTREATIARIAKAAWDAFGNKK